MKLSVQGNFCLKFAGIILGECGSDTLGPVVEFLRMLGVLISTMEQKDQIYCQSLLMTWFHGKGSQIQKIKAGYKPIKSTQTYQLGRFGTKTAPRSSISSFSRPWCRIFFGGVHFFLRVSCVAFSPFLFAYALPVTCHFRVFCFVCRFCKIVSKICNLNP